MSILEAARRLAAADPTEETDKVRCIYCGANRDIEEYGRESHAPDCPWLAMPKIVAALEAADTLAGMVRCYLANMDNSDVTPDDLAAALADFEEAQGV